MDPEYGSFADNPARFQTTRWSAILVAAQSQLLVREEIGRTVTDPAEIDQEIHALCEALIAAEGRI